jgi:hypothetical protein
MGMSLLLILCQSLLAVVVNGDGSCQSKPASLVQMRSQHAQVMARMEEKKQGLEYESQHEVLLGFQKFVSGVVDRMTGDGDDTHNTGLSGDDKQAINIIKNYIAGLYDQMLASHQCAVDYVKIQCEDQFDDCTGDTMNCMHHLETLYTSAWGHQSSHHSCRTTELTGYSGYKSTCGSYCTKKRTDAWPDCAATVFTDDVYLCAEEGSAQLAELEECLVKVHAWTTTMTDHQVPCTSDQSSWTTQQSTCYGHKSNVESTWCEYASEHDTLCGDFSTCWDEAYQKCTSSCSTIENGVKLRKVDNKTAMQIDCLLDVLLTENPDKWADLEQCIDVDPLGYSDGTEWDIACPQAGYEPKPALPNLVSNVLNASQKTCSPPVDRPCADVWQCTVYGLFGDGDACANGGFEGFSAWDNIFFLTLSSEVERKCQPCAST